MKLPNQIEKAFLLKKSFLFADLGLDHLFAIVQNMNVITLDKDEYVFKNNQSALHLYFIINGNIQLFDTQNKPLKELTQGDLFGDEALLSDQTHQYSAKCISKCHLLTLTKKHLTTIISECPSVAINLLEAYAKQVNLRNIPA